jgi:hypothetical protein
MIDQIEHLTTGQATARRITAELSDLVGGSRCSTATAIRGFRVTLPAATGRRLDNATGLAMIGRSLDSVGLGERSIRIVHHARGSWILIELPIVPA